MKTSETNYFLCVAQAYTNCIQQCCGGLSLLMFVLILIQHWVIFTNMKLYYIYCRNRSVPAYYKCPTLPKELTAKFGPLSCDLCNVQVSYKILNSVCRNQIISSYVQQNNLYESSLGVKTADCKLITYCLQMILIYDRYTQYMLNITVYKET